MNRACSGSGRHSGKRPPSSSSRAPPGRVPPPRPRSSASAASGRRSPTRRRRPCRPAWSPGPSPPTPAPASGTKLSTNPAHRRVHLRIVQRQGAGGADLEPRPRVDDVRPGVLNVGRRRVDPDHFAGIGLPQDRLDYRPGATTDIHPPRPVAMASHRRNSEATSRLHRPTYGSYAAPLAQTSVPTTAASGAVDEGTGCRSRSSPGMHESVPHRLGLRLHSQRPRPAWAGQLNAARSRLCHAPCGGTEDSLTSKWQAASVPQRLPMYLDFGRIERPCGRVTAEHGDVRP